MILRLSDGLDLIRKAIHRHGGGWMGIRSVVIRSTKVLKALGWRGFLQRIRASRQRDARAIAPPETVAFPQALAIDGSEFRVGIMLHIFYPDLLDELASDLRHMPIPFVLMVSVVDEPAKIAAYSQLQKLPNLSGLHVRVVPNRGRDVAPFLLSFRQEILALDLICHLHTKKSLYSGNEQHAWRRYLLGALLGSPKRIAWILGMFKAMPRLGMIYPESFAAVPLWAHTWLGNSAQARELGQRLDIDIDPTAYFDYPAGSMFWARTSALRPLFELDLTLDHFPEERGQNDGTLQHALERMFGLIVRKQGMLLGIMPADGSQRLASEGGRNWQTYFQFSPTEKITYATIDTEIVSFDLFDTLVLRPFLHPSGARKYLAHLVASQFGLTDFAGLRAQAEVAARARTSSDVNCAAIYDAMAHMIKLRDVPIAALHELELATERRLLRPRMTLVDAAHAQARSGKRVVAVSDMYLCNQDLHHVLPPIVSAAIEQLHVSCDNGWRKDTDQAWQNLPEIENVLPSRWLHVGDNEHADVQRPQALGFIHPVHVLRPAAMLDVVPSLRSLRPMPEQESRWQDQLWLGLIANHFAGLADRSPDAFCPTLVLNEPETLGYLALGPLVLDYVTWLARQAHEDGIDKILFLSREGYLLQRVYRQLQVHVPALQAIEGIYLLASRRGVSTPALQTIDDLAAVFAGHYTGPMRKLLQARLGERIADMAARHLGESVIAAEIFLPGMQEKIIDLLRPIATAILDVARDERSTYLEYWNNSVGSSSAIVADIGYAGTIQAQLAQLTGKTLGGAYFAVKHEADQVHTNGGWAHARFYDERIDERDSSPMMRYHLLLEAILTSPDGQFSHFESGPRGLHAVHLLNATNPLRWPIIERIHSGAERFIQDVCSVTASDTLDLAFDRALVQEPLRCIGSRQWQLGPWADALMVEDHYSGRGEINGRAA